MHVGGHTGQCPNCKEIHRWDGDYIQNIREVFDPLWKVTCPSCDYTILWGLRREPIATRTPSVKWGNTTPLKDPTGDVVILDIESKNHLKKDCRGDFSKLEFGLAGIKAFKKDSFKFFGSKDLKKLENLLNNSRLIVGYNLVQSGGIDFQMLENSGIPTNRWLSKTYDLMSTMVRSFGSFEEMSLDNISKKTLKKNKKHGKTANYKLLQQGNVETVKQRLKNELKIIEELFIKVFEGHIIDFDLKNSIHPGFELNPLLGFEPDFEEEIIESQDRPWGRTEIKRKIDEIRICKNCKSKWRVRSVSYYGDTTHEEIFCPECKASLGEVSSSHIGPLVSLEKLRAN